MGKSFLLALLVIIWGCLVGAATQPEPPKKNYYAIYLQVLNGQRSFDSLAPDEKEHILTMQRLQALACPSKPETCANACDAARKLQAAAEELARCAKKKDYSDDCRRKFRDTKFAFEEYESALSNTNGECS